MSLGLCLLKGAVIGGLVSYGLDRNARDLKQTLKEGVIVGLALGALAFLGAQLAVIGGVVCVALSVIYRYNNTISKQAVFEGALIGTLAGAALSLFH